jgi:hypothetical protein
MPRSPYAGWSFCQILRVSQFQPDPNDDVDERRLASLHAWRDARDTLYEQIFFGVYRR